MDSIFKGSGSRRGGAELIFYVWLDFMSPLGPGSVVSVHAPYSPFDSGFSG